MKPTRLSLAEWFAQPAVETLHSSESAGWHDVEVYATHLAPTLESQPTPTISDYFIVMLRRGVTPVYADVASGRTERLTMRAGTLQLLPPEFAGSARWLAPADVAFVRIRPEILHGLATNVTVGDPERTHIPLHFGFHDAVIQSLVEALCREMERPGPFGSLYVESVGQTLALHLLRHYASSRSLTLPARNATLLPAERSRIMEYIDANLDKKIMLADLAALVHVSVPHFERVFRATVGCAPYRYVQARRIERARALLLGSRLTVAEIARRCGFSDQSHFTRCFTRAVGVSPARFGSQHRRLVESELMESSSHLM